MVLGSAAHMAVFEPHLFYETYTLLRSAVDRRCKEYKEAKEKRGEEFVLVASECKKVEGIMSALRNNVEIKRILDLPGRCELSGFVNDPETGVACRHRFDKLTDCGIGIVTDCDIGIDLKTTVDARPEAFSRSVYTYAYHMQNAFYADQYEWITGRKLKDFIFLVVESESPYSVKMYRLDDESVEIGRHMYRKALDIYAQCKESGIWPGYDCNEIETLRLPEWVINGYNYSDIEFVQGD
jgi:exodeoxyribonuclease VIII